MTTLHIEINLDNDAFVDRTWEEIERILIDMIRHKQTNISDGETVSLLDINGNRCGHSFASTGREFTVLHVDCEQFATIVDHTEADSPQNAIKNVKRERGEYDLVDVFVMPGHQSSIYDPSNDSPGMPGEPREAS